MRALLLVTCLLPRAACALNESDGPECRIVSAETRIQQQGRVLEDGVFTLWDKRDGCGCVCMNSSGSADNRTADDKIAFADTSEAATATATSRQDTAFPVVSDPKPLTPLMERELRGCVDFFWNEWISDRNSPTYGMTSGDYVGLGKYSPTPIESQGFYFAAIVIGVERGWITRQEGYDRIRITLNTIKNLKNINGFHYHFIDPDMQSTRRMRSRGWGPTRGACPRA